MISLVFQSEKSVSEMKVSVLITMNSCLKRIGLHVSFLHVHFLSLLGILTTEATFRKLLLAFFLQIMRCVEENLKYASEISAD